MTTRPPRDRRDRDGVPLSRRATDRRRSGRTCARAASRVRPFFAEQELVESGVPHGDLRDPATTSGPRRPRRDRRASTRGSSAAPRARRRCWTRSSGSSSSAPGRRWSAPATTPRAYRGAIGVFAGLSAERVPRRSGSSSPEISSLGLARTSSCCRPRRTSWPPASRTSSTSAGPRSRSRPPAPPRSSPSTWPARACSPASATWPSPGASRSRSPQKAGYLLRGRTGSARATGTAAPSTPRRAARCAAAAWASWCSSGCRTPCATATRSRPSSRARP